MTIDDNFLGLRIARKTSPDAAIKREGKDQASGQYRVYQRGINERRGRYSWGEEKEGRKERGDWDRE